MYICVFVVCERVGTFTHATRVPDEYDSISRASCVVPSDAVKRISVPFVLIPESPVSDISTGKFVSSSVPRPTFEASMVISFRLVHEVLNHGVNVGVTEPDAEEAEPVPAAFVAVTVNVYGVPFVRPVMTIGETLPLAVILPGLEVTV